MPECIAWITRVRFDKASTRILWTETILFSALFGMIFRSWPIAILLFSVLFTFLHNQSRAIYAVFILSFLWGFIFAGIAIDFGWVWALVLGGIVFYKGIRIHLRDLKRSPDEWDYAGKDWSQNWHLGRQNLN